MNKKFALGLVLMQVLGFAMSASAADLPPSLIDDGSEDGSVSYFWKADGKVNGSVILRKAPNGETLGAKGEVSFSGVLARLWFERMTRAEESVSRAEFPAEMARTIVERIGKQIYCTKATFDRNRGVTHQCFVTILDATEGSIDSN